MCGRYVINNTVGFTERFQLVRPFLPGFRPTFNAAPTQQLPVIITGQDEDTGQRVAEAMRWGLIFPWAKRDGKSVPAPFNARSETVSEKPSFRRLVQRQRCLVPAVGFYEWQKRGGGKQPIFISLADQEPFAFAGLYDWSEDESGERIGSYTILTTRPNELLADIHNRMPVILHREDEEEWLDPDLTEPLALEHLYEPYPALEMQVYEVSPTVNNTRNNGPELIEPLTND